MDRRTFLKSTTISLIAPTLLLKGNTQEPLKWTSFSSKLPKKKELIVIAEQYLPNPAHFKDCTIGVKLGNKYPKFIIYNIGKMKNEMHIGSLFVVDNKKTGEKEHILIEKINIGGINEKLKPYEYPIDKNTCYWIYIKDLLKYMANKPINKANINTNIVAVKQYKACCEIYVGKIIIVNEQDIEIDLTSKHSVNTNKYPNKTWIYHYNMNSKKNDIIQWTKLPNLPN